jgi:hypothetical protein
MASSVNKVEPYYTEFATIARYTQRTRQEHMLLQFPRRHVFISHPLRCVLLRG